MGNIKPLVIPYLQAGHFRRQHQPLVVPMYHDHDTDTPGGEAPAVLVDELLLATLRVLVGDVKHLAEVLPQVVTGGSLDRPAGRADVSLHCGRVVTTSKLLLLSLLTLD